MHWLIVQRTQIQFPIPTCWLEIVAMVSKNLLPSSVFQRYQVCMCHTNTQVDKTPHALRIITFLI